MYKYQSVVISVGRGEYPSRYKRVISDRKLEYNEIVTTSDGSRCLILFEEE